MQTFGTLLPNLEVSFNAPKSVIKDLDRLSQGLSSPILLSWTTSRLYTHRTEKRHISKVCYGDFLKFYIQMKDRVSQQAKCDCIWLQLIGLSTDTTQHLV